MSPPPLIAIVDDSLLVGIVFGVGEGHLFNASVSFVTLYLGE